MQSAADILTAIEEQKTHNIRQLAKNLKMQPKQLEEIIRDLSGHNLVEYNPRTGQVALPIWLVNINKEIENVRPATGDIILPKNQEINIQDVTLGNFTKNDLELKIRLKPKRKEIAICEMS
jgi:hypothetical protein